MMRALALVLAVGCATASDRAASRLDVIYDRDRVDGTLAHIVDLARGGKPSRDLHGRYGEQYVTGLEGGALTVTVWVEPAREVSTSQVAAAVERSGGVVLEGTEGVVRARLTLEQLGALSRDPTIRMLRLARHHDPIR